MSNTDDRPIGFVGLGAMGLGMALSLVRAGFRVQGYDINHDAVAKFASSGGTTAVSAAAAAHGVRALVIMVLNATQAEDVLFGVGGAASALTEGAVVLLSSTVKPAFALETAQRLKALGVEMLDAPVSGGTARAAEGRLSVMASGSPTAFAKAQAILDAVAENVYQMGDRPGQGSTMKLVNQILAGIHIAAAAEAISFGAKAGIEPRQMYEVICNSAGASWMFENRVPHILDDDYTPRSAIEIWIKDLDIILETGKDNRFPLPLSAVAHQVYMMAAAAGYGPLDDAAVVKVFEKIADFKVMATRSEA